MKTHILSRRSLTSTFLFFYLLLVFLPTLLVIWLYSSAISTRAMNEQRYKEQMMLSQTAQYLQQSLAQSESLITSLQADALLNSLLEGRFPSASDELYAYVSHIQPLLSTLLITMPQAHDIYIYRTEGSFIGNTGMVSELVSIDDFPYDAAYLNENISRFAVMDWEKVYHKSTVTLSGPQFITLLKLYNDSYTHMTGIVETQYSLNEVLNRLKLSFDGEPLYMGWDSLYYEIGSQENGVALAETPLAGLPGNETQYISQQVGDTGLSIHRLVVFSQRMNQDIWQGILLYAVILILPTMLLYLFVMRYTVRLTRFGRAIGQGAPQRYENAGRQDELGMVISAYNDMVDANDRLFHQAQQAEKLTNAATYYAMSSQVNPHFMFNTLENIRMQIEAEHYQDASRMLFILGRFLRYNITLRRESTLREELAHIDDYIKIYQYRMSSLITFTIGRRDFDERLRCPYCMLQPIVENSLRHGIRDIGAALNITVDVTRQGEDTLITIADDGSGMSKEDIAALTERLKTPEMRDQNGENHVGLGNVNARLKYFYGERYGITVLPNQPCGLICRLLVGPTPRGEEKGI